MRSFALLTCGGSAIFRYPGSSWIPCIWLAEKRRHREWRTEPGSDGHCLHPHPFGLTARETGEYNLAACSERRGNRFGEHLDSICHII